MNKKNRRKGLNRKHKNICIKKRKDKNVNIFLAPLNIAIPHVNSFFAYSFHLYDQRWN